MSIGSASASSLPLPRAWPGTRVGQSRIKAGLTGVGGGAGGGGVGSGESGAVQMLLCKWLGPQNPATIALGSPECPVALCGPDGHSIPDIPDTCMHTHRCTHACICSHMCTYVLSENRRGSDSWRVPIPSLKVPSPSATYPWPCSHFLPKLLKYSGAPGSHCMFLF